MSFELLYDDTNTTFSEQIESLAADMETSEQDSNTSKEIQDDNAQQPEKEESSRERNLRIMREAKEEAEREQRRAIKERDAALRKMRELEEQRYGVPQQDDSRTDDIQIGEDDLVEGKHVKQVYKELKAVKKQLEDQKNSYHTQTIESRIRSEYPDFSKVVTPENLEILRRLKPRQAALIDKSPDLYDAAASAYEMMKEYGIYESDEIQLEKIRSKAAAQQNTAKPKPSVAVSPQRGDSPLSKVNAFNMELTPQLKEQLYKEMMEAASRR